MGSFKNGLNIGLSIAQTACEALSFLGGQAQELGDAGAAACKAKKAVLNGQGTRKSAKVDADKQFDVLYKQFRDETKFHRAAEQLAGTAVKDDSPITRTMLRNAKVNLCNLEDLVDYDEEPEDEDDEETTPPPVREKKAPPVESTRPKKVKGTRKIVKAGDPTGFNKTHQFN